MQFHPITYSLSNIPLILSNRIKLGCRISPSCCSYAQVTWYGTWAAYPPSSNTGSMSDFTELPIIRSFSGGQPNVSIKPLVIIDFLVTHNFI